MVLAACDGGGTTPPPGGKDATVAAKDGSASDGAANPDATEQTDATENDSGAVDCNTNPAGCEPGRLKGPAPACMCLTGCLPGYHWTGTACEADPMDASAPDAQLRWVSV